ncbi:MAG: methyltransferase domain-containing protein [bacterium]
MNTKGNSEFEIKVGDSITTKNSGWKFDKSVAAHFEKHVRRSIPFYEEGHQLVCELSDFFVQDGSICYEIGTSVGELIKKIAIHNNHKSATFIGIDKEEGMIEKAREKCALISSVKLETVDVNLIDFENSDFIVSYYCIQFIPPKFRQQLFDKIYQSLNWGGAFVLFEKVRGSDARFQDILSALYAEFKINQGFSPEEIISKSQSLKGVLEPFSVQGNIDLLKRAGFKDIETIMKYTCFQGFLAIK